VEHFGGRELDFVAVAVEQVPAHRDGDAQHAHDDEHHAPAEGQHQDREDGRRQRRSDGGGGHEDAGRSAALAHGKPFRDHLGAGRELRRFAQPQEDPRHQELLQVVDEAAGQLRHRPDEHARAQHHACAELVEHGADGQLREGIGQREGREQQAHLRGREIEFLAHRVIGDGQGAAVEVVDDAGQHQEAQRDHL
ncbi:conserved hypothetical protein, partial [Ricinus communis]